MLEVTTLRKYASQYNIRFTNMSVSNNRTKYIVLLVRRYQTENYERRRHAEQTPNYNKVYTDTAMTTRHAQVKT